MALTPPTSTFDSPVKGLFRYGESPFWASFVFSGQPVKGVVLPFPHDDRYGALEVHAVAWEIYTEDKQDLLDLMWKGTLSWSFSNTKVPIGPLSLFNGSFFDMFFSQGTLSDLEALARTKEEGEWRELCQTFLMGQNYFFRGLSRYQQHPVLLPKGSDWQVRVDFDEPFQPRADARIRVVLNGRWKTEIQVG